MPSLFSLVVVLLDKYLVPFLFSVGLFFFVYGIIEYFIIGRAGDEERAQGGREMFLKAIGWFLVALIAHVITLFLGFVASLSWPAINGVVPDRGSGARVDVDRNDAVLEIPDVPSR